MTIDCPVALIADRVFIVNCLFLFSLQFRSQNSSGFAKTRARRQIMKMFISRKHTSNSYAIWTMKLDDCKKPNIFITMVSQTISASILLAPMCSHDDGNKMCLLFCFQMMLIIITTAFRRKHLISYQVTWPN